MAKGVAHAGKGKSLSSGEAHENERRGWSEDSYRRKNLQPFNNYDWSRRGLNFEVVNGQVRPLGSQEVSLYQRYQNLIKELDFKEYKAGATNQQHTYVELILSGSTERMQKIAFGDQKVDYTRNPEQWRNWGVTRTTGKGSIEEWALDTYKFVCNKYGEENIIGFEVHLDEKEPHAHVNIVPTAIKKQRGNVSGYHKVDADGNPVVYTKGKHVGEIIKISESKYNALSDDKKQEYRKNERGSVRTISFASHFGDKTAERRQKGYELHDEFYLQVGKKWGFDRGDVWAELPDDDRRKRKRLTKQQAFEKQEAEKAKESAIKEAQKQQSVVDANIKEIREQEESIRQLSQAVETKSGELLQVNTDIEQQSAVLENLENAIAEKRQEQERINKETWLDTMKGLVNKSDKDRKYLAEIERLEKENLAVDEKGKPVLYKSGNQASWPRYAELLRTMIQREKDKRQPAIDAAVSEVNEKHQAQVKILNEKISSLQGKLKEKERLIDRLTKEKEELLKRIKAIKDSFMNTIFGPKFRAAVTAIIDRFNGNQDWFTLPQKGIIETSLATESTIESRKELGKDAVDVARIIIEDPDEWKRIPAEVDQIAENKWDENQALLQKAAAAVVSVSKTSGRKNFTPEEGEAVGAYLKTGGSADDIWNAAKDNVGYWGDYARRVLNAYASGQTISQGLKV